MSSRTPHHSRHLGSLWPGLPREHFARRRMIRTIFEVVVIAILSIIVAGIIVYNSDPAGFSTLRH